MDIKSENKERQTDSRAMRERKTNINWSKKIDREKVSSERVTHSETRQTRERE
jgi:hypothetical protein